MLSNRYSSLLPLVTIAVFASAPRLTSACLPAAPVVESTEPGPAKTYPANAGVALIGYSLDLTALTATIDDQPVSLALDEELSEHDYFGDYRVLVVRTLPAPLPGQVVHLQGSVCGLDWDPCPADASVDLEYVAGEPDLEAPKAPEAVMLDAYDHGFHPELSCDCPSFGGSRYAISVSADLVKPTGPMIRHVLGIRPKEDPGAIPTILEAGWGWNAFGLIDADKLNTDAYCAVAYTTDLAGNKSEVIESCTVCHIQQGEGEGECGFLCGGDYPCSEPEYPCTSIANPGACSQSLLDQCRVVDTTGGAETTGGSTSATTDTTTNAGSTTDVGQTITTAGNAADAGGVDTGGGKAGCACNVGTGGDSDLAFLTLCFLLSPLCASRRKLPRAWHGSVTGSPTTKSGVPRAVERAVHRQRSTDRHGQPDQDRIRALQEFETRALALLEIPTVGYSHDPLAQGVHIPWRSDRIPDEGVTADIDANDPRWTPIDEPGRPWSIPNKLVPKGYERQFFPVT